MKRQACQFISKNTDDIILDADSTLVTTNGKQEAAAYISHYNEIGYHPLVINEYNTKLLVSFQLRAGNAYSSNGIIEELQEILPYIFGKDHRLIRFRGDSTFYNSDLMKYFESMNCLYFIRTKGYKKLQRTIMDFYEARGTSEYFAKELKNDFNAVTLSHKDFNRNEMEFLISSYAYNLFHMFQLETLEGNEKTITMGIYRKE